MPVLPPALSLAALLAGQVPDAGAPPPGGAADPRDPWGETSGAAPVATTEVEPRRWSGAAFFLEEDAFNVSQKSDRNYTGGGAFQLSGRWVREARLTRPLDALDHLFGVDALARRLFGLPAPGGAIPLGNVGPVVKGYTFTFGLTAFTPRNLRVSTPIPDDRPYASLDYVSVSRSYASDRAGLAMSSDATLGVLGRHDGHWIQKTIHASMRGAKGCSSDDPACGPPDPKGWDNQISEGGELTARYSVWLEKRLSSLALWGRALSYDLKLTGKGELGYYTAASFGGAVRFGHIESPFWSYDTAPMQGANQALVAAERRRDLGALGFELYAWAGLRGRFTAYNALLQGQLRKSAVAFSGDELERFQYDYEAGLTAAFRNVSVAWAAFMGRSPEISVGQVRHHVWSSFYLAWRA